MDNKRNVLLLFLTLIMYSCSPAPLRMLSDETLTLSRFDVALNDSLVFKKWDAIALETTDASLIKNIDRICRDKDTLFVFDRSLNKIAIFKSDGHHIRTIHDVGTGPKEYIHLSDICVDTKHKQIILLCDRPYKFMYYTYSGEFVKETDYLGHNSSFVIKDGLIYCYTETKEDASVFNIYSTEAKLLNEVHIPLAESFKSDDTGVVNRLSDGNNLTLGKEDAYFTRQFDNSIYTFFEGEVHPKYTIDFQKHQMPSKLNQKYKLPFDFIDECDRKKYVYSITDVMENDNTLLFKTNLGIFLYDKTIKELNGFCFIRNNSLGGGVSTVMSMNDGKHLAVKYESTVFKKMIGKSRERKIKVADRLLKVYNSIDEESNPILLIYRF